MFTYNSNTLEPASYASWSPSTIDQQPSRAKQQGERSERPSPTASAFSARSHTSTHAQPSFGSNKLVRCSVSDNSKGRGSFNDSHSDSDSDTHSHLCAVTLSPHHLLLREGERRMAKPLASLRASRSVFNYTLEVEVRVAHFFPLFLTLTAPRATTISTTRSWASRMADGE